MYAFKNFIRRGLPTLNSLIGGGRKLVNKERLKKLKLVEFVGKDILRERQSTWNRYHSLVPMTYSIEKVFKNS